MNWSDLTIDKITSLYLYGQENPPTNLFDRIRPSDATAPVIQMDAASFMQNGPGTYALPAFSNFVQWFFAGSGPSTNGYDPIAQLFAQAAASGRPIKISVADLISTYGNTQRDFDVKIQQSRFSPDLQLGGGSYGARTYIYNSESFKMRGDTVFVFDSVGAHIENLALIPYDDQFGFESGDPLAAIGNIYLQPLVDPFGLARGQDPRVTIEMINKENVPVIASYARDNFVADQRTISSFYNSAVAATPVAYAAMDDIVKQLTNDGVLYRDKNGVPIIYGTPGDDNLGSSTLQKLSITNPSPIILVGGPGNDTISGGQLDDTIYAGSGNDTIIGSGGNDAIYGSASGSTTLLYKNLGAPRI